MSMPPTSVLSGLLILVSFLLAHSVVEVEGTQWVEPVILWITVGMPTGSGKSSLFNFFLNLLRKVRERCNRKDIHPSWMVEESSFEKMGALRPTMMQSSWVCMMNSVLSSPKLTCMEAKESVTHMILQHS